jgi:hypothetical protein
MGISRRRLLTAGCGSLLAAGLGGCAGAARPDPDAAAIGRLLDRRATAVLRRDRDALAATVLPGATGLLTRQLAWLGDLAQVPLAGWAYRLVALDAYPLPPALGTGERRAAQVRLSYRLAGFDSQPVTADQYLTFERSGSHWYLGSDTDHPGGDTELWDLGPVTAVHGRSSLVLGLDPAARLRPFAALADRAVPAVSAVWGDDWGGRTVLLVPATTGQFGSLLGADPQDFAATAAVTSGEYGAAEALRTERITVNPPVWAELTALGRQVVTTHETTHVATRAITDTWTPRWLAEGAANWTGYLGTGLTPRQICPELQAAVAAGFRPAGLPADSAFDGTAPDLAQSYELAWFACRSMVLRHGPPALVAFYRAVAAAGGSGGQQAAVDQALRRTLGQDTAAFTAQWRADLLAALR